MNQISLRAYTRELEGMIENGRAEEAVSHCQFILKTFPLHLETYRLLGKAFLENRQFKEAADIFQRVLMAVPDDFVSHVGMSIIKDEDGKLDEAIWHMERAFEVQPSNPAINDELRKLYGRRDGMDPARIRLTRDALANMYIQGALYGQAITEIKSIQAEDHNRPDLDVLLVRAYFLDGRKNQAIDVCTNLLHTHPYCLTALETLIELIPQGEKQEIIQSYRQRVNSLDPYTQFTSGSIFDTEKVADELVMLGHLDYDPLMHPIENQTTWESALGIQFDAEKGLAITENPPGDKELPVEQTDSNVAPETAAAAVSEAGQDVAVPEWMLSSGWQQGDSGQSSQAVVVPDEVKPVASDSLAKAEIPDWLKEMVPEGQEQAGQTTQDQSFQPEPAGIMPSVEASSAPTQDVMAVPAHEEPGTISNDEIPDWLKESLPASSDVSTGIGNTLESVPLDEIPDWLKEFSADQPITSQEEKDISLENEGSLELESAGPRPNVTLESDVTSSITEDQPGEATGEGLAIPSAEGAGLPAFEQKDDFSSWLSETRSTSSSLETGGTNEEDLPEWLRTIRAEAETPPQELNVSTDNSTPEIVTSEPSAVAEMAGEPVAPVEEKSVPPQSNINEPEVAEDSLGAVSGQDEFGISAPQTSVGEQPVEAEAPAIAPIPAQPETLSEMPSGISQFTPIPAEDSRTGLAWLEGLAAKEGAKPEELVTSPDERPEVPPEWVSKSMSTIPGQPAEGTFQVNISEAASQPEIKTDSELIPEPTSLEPLQEEPNKSDLFLDGILAVREPEEQADGSREVEQGFSPEAQDLEQKVDFSQEPRIEGAQDQVTLEQPTDEIQVTDFPAKEPPAGVSQAWVAESEAGSISENQTTPETLNPEEQVTVSQEPEALGYAPEKEVSLGDAQPMKPEDWQPISEPKLEPGQEMQATSGEPPASGTTSITSADAAIEPDSPESAISLIERGELKPGILVFSRLIRKGQSMPTLLAHILDLTRKYPDQFEIWQLLGDGYMRNNQLQKAMEAYSRAEELLH